MSLTDLSKENLPPLDKQDKPAPLRLALQNLSNSTKTLHQAIRKGRCFEYSSEILNNLLKDESNFQVPSRFLQSQADITPKMRSILVDWLVSVHRRFKLMPETLFLAVKISDRYLLSQETIRKDLQLVGVTALFIAAKYEEIYPPELRDLILLTDRAYSKDQALAMEKKILKCLDFIITMPSSWRFFENFTEGLSEDIKSMGQYLLELSLLDENMLKFSESLLAASAVFVAEKFFKKDPRYTLPVYSEPEIRSCATELLILFQIALNHPLTAIRDKFSKPQFHQVSTICLE